MSRYDDIVLELTQRAPEIADQCQPTGITFIERCQFQSLYPLSPAEIEELRAFQLQHPDDPECADDLIEVTPYLAFEGVLRPFLFQLLREPSRHWRLRELLDWLDALLVCDDSHVRTLVAIGICEALISAHVDDFPALFPFLGANLRRSCRDFLAILSGERRNSRFAQLLTTLKTGGLLQL